MSRPNKTPLTTDNLAADGIQGADAKTLRPCEAKHSPQTCTARFLALAAMDVAQAQLDRYALATDDSEPGVVDAADLLDAARAAMAGAP